MGRKESDLSGLLVRSLKSWKYAAKRDKSKDNSKKQHKVHRNYRYYCWNTKSKKMCREEVPFMECPSSVEEFP